MDREKQAETLLKSRLDVKSFNIPPYTALNEGKKRVKYFDSEGILCSSSLSDACGKVAGVYRHEDGSLSATVYYPKLIGHNNGGLFIKAVNQTKPGLHMKTLFVSVKAPGIISTQSLTGSQGLLQGLVPQL